MKFFRVFLIYCCICAKIQAQDTVVVFDRPGVAESPYVVDAKRWQIESGLGYASFSGISEALFPAVLLRKYIFKNTEIRAAFNYEPQMIAIIKDDIIKDYDPLALGLKIKIWKEKKYLPEATFILNTYFPMQLLGKKNSGIFNVEGAFQFQNNFAEVWAFNYNVGTIFASTYPKGVLSYASCLSFAANKKIGLFGEIFGYQPFVNRGEIGADVGIVYNPTKRSQVDLSIIDNVVNRIHYLSGLLGFSFYF